MRRGFIWLWGLGTLLIAALVGAAAYAAGVATHVTNAVAPNGTPYPYYYGPHFFFFPFGFVFPLLFILFILWLVFRPRRWWYGGGGPGPHGPGHLEQRLEEWHKKAHGETSPTATDKPT
ncbi:MAG TPA: hypothetical protein VF160_00460 [Candidatus Dormibacteraeota bacterium]